MNTKARKYHQESLDVVNDDLIWQEPCQFGGGRRDKFGDVRVSYSTKGERYTLTFYNSCHEMFTDNDTIIFAVSGNRCYFKKPSEGQPYWTLSKTSDSERRTIQPKSRKLHAFLNDDGSPKRYEMKYDEVRNLNYIERT